MRWVCHTFLGRASDHPKPPIASSTTDRHTSAQLAESELSCQPFESLATFLARGRMTSRRVVEKRSSV